MQFKKNHTEKPLTTVEAASYLGLKAGTLEVWRVQGKGPRFMRLGGRTIRYRRGDLDMFMDESVCTSTSEI